MTLSQIQLEILERLHGKLRRGDISSIAQKTGFTREYVGMVLNKDSGHFNEEIVAEAIKIANENEQNTKKLLQTITESQDLKQSA